MPLIVNIIKAGAHTRRIQLLCTARICQTAPAAHRLDATEVLAVTVSVQNRGALLRRRRGFPSLVRVSLHRAFLWFSAFYLRVALPWLHALRLAFSARIASVR